MLLIAKILFYIVTTNNYSDYFTFDVFVLVHCLLFPVVSK